MSIIKLFFNICLCISLANPVLSKPLPPNFLLDVDGISLGGGHSHLCAIESTPDVYMGGVIKCWGELVRKKANIPPKDVRWHIILLSYC
jgi:hypothetical protein